MASHEPSVSKRSRSPAVQLEAYVYPRNLRADIAANITENSACCLNDNPKTHRRNCPGRCEVQQSIPKRAAAHATHGSSRFGSFSQFKLPHASSFYAEISGLGVLFPSIDSRHGTCESVSRRDENGVHTSSLFAVTRVDNEMCQISRDYAV